MTGANIAVVELFAVFHDACRVNEAVDPGHGQRGADLAAELRGDLFHLPDADFRLLYDACVGHTDGETDADITIQTCWDADRLDLGRVSMVPDPRKLCTSAAKRPETLRWADGRGTFQVIPAFTSGEWGIDTRD